MITRRLSVLSLAGVLLALSAGAARAFEVLGDRKGNLELSALGSYSAAHYTGNTAGVHTSIDTTQTNVAGGVGYFVMKPLELGMQINAIGQSSNFTVNGITTKSNSTFVLWSPFAKWHFGLPNPRIVPYVGMGAAVGAITTSGSSVTNIAGFDINEGCDFFVSERVAISPQLSEDIESETQAGNTFSGTNITFAVALKSFFF